MLYFLLYGILGAVLACVGWMVLALVIGLENTDERIWFYGFFFVIAWGVGLATFAALRARRSLIPHLSMLMVGSTIVVTGLIAGNIYAAKAAPIQGWERLGLVIACGLWYASAAIGSLGFVCGLSGLALSLMDKPAPTARATAGSHPPPASHRETPPVPVQRPA